MAFRKFMKAEKVESADREVKGVLREANVKRVSDLSKDDRSRLRDRLKR